MVRTPFGANLDGAGILLNRLDEIEERWGSEPVWVVGTNVEYSVYVEFGTSRMAAQPYLRPAVREAMRDIDHIADQSDSTEELVARLALRIERHAKQVVAVDTGNLKNSIRAEKIQ